MTSWLVVPRLDVITVGAGVGTSEDISFAR
jgi:hypothetical protein